jgi:transcriptional regulator
MLRWGYLTSRQSEMWGLARSGLTESEISRKLDVSRQSVHIMLDAARNKVMQALNEAAEVNRIQIQHMEIEKGILVGHSQEFDHKVVITYSPKNGVRLWYAHDQECRECKFDKSWVKTILAEAQERGITLSSKELRLQPPELAKVVFGKILPGVEL